MVSYAVFLSVTYLAIIKTFKLMYWCDQWDHVEFRNTALRFKKKMWKYLCENIWDNICLCYAKSHRHLIIQITMKKTKQKNKQPTDIVLLYQAVHSDCANRKGKTWNSCKFERLKLHGAFDFKRVIKWYKLWYHMLWTLQQLLQSQLLIEHHNFSRKHLAIVRLQIQT